ncbi:peptidoglycan-binding protein, partial [Saccharomonospora sp.]|uniref:peptidoglycan-binding protein n=1 Tax=Saccharomonospora sp. TaxID=33913 RepID=UPI002636C09E
MANANGRISKSNLAALPKVFSNKRETEYLTSSAYASLVRMMLRAVADTNTNFSVWSAYRSFDDQVAMLKLNYTRVSRGRSLSSDRSYGGSTWAKKPGRPLTASPGYSNHGNGLAVDIHPGPIQTWLKANAGRFGWVNDVPSEPWHFSYLNPGRDQFRSEGLPNVAGMQKKLGIEADGKPGKGFVAAVKAFQKANGLDVDGKAGPATVKAILGGKGSVAPAPSGPAGGTSKPVPAPSSDLPALPEVETSKTSPNKNTDRRGHSITSVTVHWWGTPSGQSFDGIVNWLCDPKAQVSAHYVINPSRVARIVDEDHRSWANGNADGNSSSITIECDPNDVPGTLPVLAALIADIRSRHGDLPIYPHSHWTSTQCPGDYLPHLDAVDKAARTGKAVVPSGGTSKPTPAKPKKVAEDGRLGRETVKALQGILGVTADGRAGEATWKALQKRLGTPVDGFVSHQSYKATELGNGVVPRAWRYTGRGSKGS